MLSRPAVFHKGLVTRLSRPGLIENNTPRLALKTLNHASHTVGKLLGSLDGHNTVILENYHVVISVFKSGVQLLGVLVAQIQILDHTPAALGYRADLYVLAVLFSQCSEQFGQIAEEGVTVSNK